MRHREQYAATYPYVLIRSIHDDSDPTQGITYYRERPEYDNGYNDGDTFITAEHEIGECELYAPDFPELDEMTS